MKCIVLLSLFPINPETDVVSQLYQQVENPVRRRNNWLKHGNRASGLTHKNTYMCWKVKSQVIGFDSGPLLRDNTRVSIDP